MTTADRPVATIKSRLGVLDIVGETVVLKRTGASYKGLCPFHGEKTPSFVVSPERESWHCFGCGEGGDIFAFVMRRDAVDFREALRRLAERAGVELSERSAREDRRRRRLREALEAAIGFYREVLLHAEVAGRARDYLAERGFADETLDRFGIGFAPAAWQALTRRLLARSFTQEELVSAGLATASRDRGAYDRFRGRIIFPIRDAAGGAIGLGGRLLPGGEGPKYLNSPATPLFDKSRTLYAIDLAKGAMRREKLAVIVEGYTDVMAAHQAGFGNVVASLGTALTGGQITLATRYADAVALAYDVDLAGEAATQRGLLEELGPEQSVTKVRVIRIPAGKDPDELIRSDPAAWARAVEEAKPVIEYFMERAADGVDLRSVDGRREVSGTVLRLLRRVADPLERTMYLQQLARLVNVDEVVLAEALRGRRRDRQTVAMTAARTPTRTPTAAADETPLEREALQLLLRYPAVAEDAEAVDQPPLRSSPAVALFEALREWHRRGEPFVLREFLESLDPATGELARAVLTTAPEAGAGEEALDPDAAREAFRVCILRLRAQRIEEAINHGRLLLEEAVRDRDRQRIEEIGHRIDRLGREKDEVTRMISEPTRATGTRRN